MVEDQRTEPTSGSVKSKDFLNVCSPQPTAEQSQPEPVAAPLSLSLAVVTAADAATAVTAIVSAPITNATFSTPSSSSSSSPSSRMSTASPGAHQLSSPMIVESALPLGSDGDGAESVITRHLLPIAAPLSPVIVASAGMVDSEPEVVHIRIPPNRSNKSNDLIFSLPHPPRPSSSSLSPSPLLTSSTTVSTITATTTSTSLPTVPKVSVRNDLTHLTVVDSASAEVRPYIKKFLCFFLHSVQFTNQLQSAKHRTHA
jgi:hypothetical protein